MARSYTKFECLNSRRLSALSTLFVAQTLDRIQTGGVNCGHHAADNPDQTENDGCLGQAAHIDVKVDVSSLEVVAESAHQGQGSDSPGNNVGNCDPGQATGKGDSKGLGKKLEQDVGLVRPQCLFDADFSRALLHRDQHDVHQADPSDAQGQRSDKSKQDLECGGDNRELVEVLFKIGHEHGAAVVRTK